MELFKIDESRNSTGSNCPNGPLDINLNDLDDKLLIPRKKISFLALSFKRLVL